MAPSWISKYPEIASCLVTIVGCMITLRCGLASMILLGRGAMTARPASDGFPPGPDGTLSKSLTDRLAVDRETVIG